MRPWTSGCLAHTGTDVPLGYLFYSCLWLCVLLQKTRKNNLVSPVKSFGKILTGLARHVKIEQAPIPIILLQNYAISWRGWVLSEFCVPLGFDENVSDYCGWCKRLWRSGATSLWFSSSLWKDKGVNLTQDHGSRTRYLWRQLLPDLKKRDTSVVVVAAYFCSTKVWTKYTFFSACFELISTTTMQTSWHTVPWCVSISWPSGRAVHDSMRSSVQHQLPQDSMHQRSTRFSTTTGAGWFSFLCCNTRKMQFPLSRLAKGTGTVAYSGVGETSKNTNCLTGGQPPLCGFWFC